MKFVTDLHLHSKYSRAVSQQMTLPNMAHWAKLKGIDVLATGDFTHPFWYDHLRSELEEEGNGLFRIKSQESGVEGNKSHFLLSCEVSSIYSQGGKGRRIHTLFMFPSFEAVEKFNKELLRRRANLRSDGRPIVGIPSRDLAAIALECSDRALVIPAHAWTPWFSIYGSFSGFDSVEECFGDMAKHIYGVETGLSSDPAMNWQVGDLDNRAILSFSDAHSLEKMGREATVIEADEISYQSIYDAVARIAGPVSSFPPVSARSDQKSKLDTNNNPELRAGGNPSTTATRNSRIVFTIEFYPEEGKYHFTGHRNCNYSQGPEEDRNKPCPVCGRSLTVGVMDRVKDLKSQESRVRSQEIGGVVWKKSETNRPSYVSMVPLGEIIAEALEVGVGTQKVKDNYLSLVGVLGTEFGVLMKASIQDIAKFSSGRIAEAVGKVRQGDIVIEPGYDGQFGIVKIWKEGNEPAGEKEIQADPQLNLF